MNPFYFSSTPNTYFNAQFSFKYEDFILPTSIASNSQEYLPIFQQSSSRSPQYQALIVKYQELLEKNKQLKEELQNKLQNLKPRDKIINNCRRKYIRRKQEEIQKNKSCPYPNCSKQYVTQSSLNFHIKQKHNGGRKSQRIQLAKKIIIAKKRHQRMPVQQIALPPGYLRQIKNFLLKDENSDSEFIYSQQSKQSN